MEERSRHAAKGSSDDGVEVARVECRVILTHRMADTKGEDRQRDTRRHEARCDVMARGCPPNLTGISALPIPPCARAFRWAHLCTHLLLPEFSSSHSTPISPRDGEHAKRFSNWHQSEDACHVLHSKDDEFGVHFN